MNQTYFSVCAVYACAGRKGRKNTSGRIRQVFVFAWNVMTSLHYYAIHAIPQSDCCHYYAIITQFTPFCILIGHDKILVRDKLSQRKPGQTVFFQRFLRPPIKKLTYTRKNTVWFTRLSYQHALIILKTLP